MKRIIILALIFSPLSFAWDLNKKVDPITDEQILTIIQSATSGSNAYGKKPRMTIRCNEKAIDHIVNWGVFVSNENQQVVYRIDKNEPISESSLISSNYQSTFSREPLELIKQMKAGNSIYIRTTPHSSNPITASFNLIGFTKSVKLLEDLCEPAIAEKEVERQRVSEELDNKGEQLMKTAVTVGDWAKAGYYRCIALGKPCIKAANSCNTSADVAALKSCMIMQTSLSNLFD